MRITIVQGAFFPVPAVMGGAVEKVWHALGKEFSKQGHEVTHVSRQHLGLPVSEVVDGVRHMRIRGFDAPASLLRLKVLDLIYSLRALRHLPPADILVTNTFWLPILVRDRRCGETYVHVARHPKGQMRFYARVARLQTVSQSVAAAIEREAPRLRAKVRVIPYPFIDNGTAEQSGRREKRILYVGRIHPEKGLHLLLKAFAAIPHEKPDGWRLAIVGPSDLRFGGGGEAYLHDLHTLAEPIADRVDWLGPVFDPLRLSAIYREASIFVYPSLADRGETFGLAPLEAMSHGCALVVSSLPCFRDFIHDEVDGLFFDHLSDKPECQLADRLMELMRDETQRLRLSIAAVSKAKEYGLERIASLFLDDFRSILKPSAGDAATPLKHG